MSKRFALSLLPSVMSVAAALLLLQLISFKTLQRMLMKAADPLLNGVAQINEEFINVA
jgi:hypothetical protein